MTWGWVISYRISIFGWIPICTKKITDLCYHFLYTYKRQETIPHIFFHKCYYVWLFVEMLLMFEHIPPKSPISTQLASDPFYKKHQLKYNFKFILCGRLNHIVLSVKINGAQSFLLRNASGKPQGKQVYNVWSEETELSTRDNSSALYAADVRCFFFHLTPVYWGKMASSYHKWFSSTTIFRKRWRSFPKTNTYCS